MRSCVLRMRKRLGDERVNDALELVRERKLEEIAQLLVEFYDKLYDRNIVCATGTSNDLGDGEGFAGGRSCEIKKVEYIDWLTKKRDLIDFTPEPLCRGVWNTLHGLEPWMQAGKREGEGGEALK